MDRNAVQVMLAATKQDGSPAMTVAEIAAHFRVSARTIQRIRKETRVTDADDTRTRQARGVGRPSAARQHQDAVERLMREHPAAPPLEILRLMRCDGAQITERTLYRAYRAVKAVAAHEMIVRFEGVPGEFAQFDFGELDIVWTGRGPASGTTRDTSGRVGCKARVHFAAYRLKYSRYMYVGVVPNQQSESVVRSLVAGFEATAGVPLSVVFDRPTTVLIKEWKEQGTNAHGETVEQTRREYNAALAQCAVDFGFVIDLAAPRSGNQKGCVENLVKFVKRNFFTARTFVDHEDLAQQLTAWLCEVNTRRPCDATGVIPAERVREEQQRMREPLCRAAEYGMKYPGFVRTTGLVHWWEGRRYAMPAEACGLPCTVVVYPETVYLYTAHKTYEATHPRVPADGARVSYLTGKRAAQLAKIHGERKRTYYMRERILELGEIGLAFMTELVHRRQRTWQGDVARLFQLLETIGEAHFRQLLKRALFQSLIGADYVERLAKQLPREVQLGLPLQHQSGDSSIPASSPSSKEA